VWPPYSPILTPLDFFLSGCVKEQVYNQGMNMLGDLKSWIMAAIVNVTKDVLTVRPAAGGP
jgi:hypothetical protein